MQNNESILKSLAATIHKNKRNAAGNTEKVVHPWFRASQRFYVTAEGTVADCSLRIA